MKRAVHLDYLDFSRLELRKAALETELRLNRRTASALYIAVHAITSDVDGGLALDGEGRPVEWLLEMLRFPDDARLDRHIAANPLPPAVLRRLGDRIHSFHASVEVSSSPGAALALLEVIEGNVSSMRKFPDILDRTLVRDLAGQHRTLWRSLAPLLEERRRMGRVRHGHGDLHLTNIAMIDGEAVPFDCLEFSPDLATVDVLYDLAFLLMDLWHYGCRKEANLVFNRYFDLSPEDEAGLPLLPLFLSMRAAVLTHVLALQAQGAGNKELAAQAQAYLRLASELVEPVEPRLVAIGGLSGSGKSTLAASLAHELGRAPGARIFRSDVLRKRLAGVAPETSLDESRYSLAANAQAYGLLRSLTVDALGHGHSAVADAVFARQPERKAIEAVAGDTGTTFTGIWLATEEERRVERVLARTSDASDADVIIARTQSAYAIGRLDGWVSIDASGAFERTLEAARLSLRLI
ncbi:bifunctional aminoglycoside phosphotransferase/ATP-binding protein [Tardibacter chloracetimidivorans]|nr:AAA family ATPase [Tardibacter chloracetimidivorans]